MDDIIQLTFRIFIGSILFFNLVILPVYAIFGGIFNLGKYCIKKINLIK